MDKPKVLLVGEHPLGTTGNCGMMFSISREIDLKKYDASLAVVGTAIDLPTTLFRYFPLPILSISREHEFWGQSNLLEIVQHGVFDILMFIGIDLWRYIDILPEIIKFRDKKGFKIGGLFPYDLYNVRDDFVEIAKAMDFPCVYSQYGYDMLKENVPHIRYYRPKLHMENIWQPKTKDAIERIRRHLFYGTPISFDAFMIGFVGINQYRKDPQKLIKAFSMFSRKYANSVLYMHTEKVSGVYNIAQYAMDCNIESGRLLTKPDYRRYPLHMMPDVYGCMDVYANCSIQEGLSWTVIESMLCGVPAIISDSTAHKELKVDDNLMVPCETPCSLPISVKTGQNWVDAFCCRPDDIVRSMEWYYNLSDDGKEEIKQLSLKKGREWKEGCHNPNDLLEEVSKSKKVMVKIIKEAVLFAQHSAAGDIFMTTRCLPALRKRHPDLPFHYMTQEKYHDILEGNPCIDEIIPWKPHVLTEKSYKHIYNPHGDIILPGHWGRNCNSILSDFYWKILRVEPSPFFIEQIEPKIDIPSDFKIAIVHTTGGDPEFRTYKYMKPVSEYLNRLGFYVIQLGVKDDFPADANLDLRGKLSFRESAWVMGRASIAITVDSFMSHLAGALGINQVCLFGSGNYVVVQPWQKPGSNLICMVPDYVYDCKGLGPCSASVRDCPVPCTGRHDPVDVMLAISQIVSGNVENSIMREKAS